MTYKKPAQTVAFDGDRLDLLRGLIANLFVDEWQAAAGMISRVSEMGKHKLKSDMLSKELYFEQAIIRAIHQAHEERTPATFGGILSYLRVNDTSKDVEAKLRNIYGYRTEDPDVQSLAAALGDWMDVQKEIASLHAAIAIAQGQYMTSKEAYLLFAKTIADNAPASKEKSERTFPGALKAWKQQRLETANNIRAGIPIGPNFPWAVLRDKIPALKMGWLTTIIAKTGHGKSTIALILAIHWAHVQGYDVLFLHLETDVVDMMDRYIAAELLIPADAWDTGATINGTTDRAFVDQEPFKSQIEETETKIEELNETMGYIDYIHCPGIVPEDLRAEVVRHKVISEMRGRELIVIVDYYSEADTTGLGFNVAERNNWMADFLKEVAESEESKCYMIALAQFDPDAAYDEKSKSWNGGKLYMRSQAYIRIEREIATSEVWWRKGGQVMKDFLQQPIKLQDIGDWSAKTTLNVIKCNQGKTGEVLTLFVNGYFKIIDFPKPQANN